jgi:hypothetical protein
MVTKEEQAESVTSGSSQSDGSDETFREFARRVHLVEIIGAIILSLATVSSAWSAYQATRWSGVQATSFGEANTNRTESVRLDNYANTQTAVDVGVFLDWVTAKSEGDQVRADFLEGRFRDEFKPAFEAWLALATPDDPIPPGSPFSLPEYELASRTEADQLAQVASEKFETAKDANQTGDNFILTTVLFASVLFFAGIANNLDSLRVRQAVLFLAFVTWLSATVIMFSLPQNVGF